jgi:hypothetical protein
MNNALPFPPYHEPLRQTLARTITIALVIGAVLAQWPIAGPTSRSTTPFLTRWGVGTLLALWPSLGGHFVELFFLNHLRQRLPTTRATQAAARLATWFIAGALLTLAMKQTAATLFNASGIAAMPSQRLYLFGGLAFIAIELTAHLALHLRHRPNIYNGQG